MISESIDKMQELIVKTDKLSMDINSKDYISIRDAIRKISIVDEIYKEKRNLDKYKLNNKEIRKLKFMEKFSKIKNNYQMFIPISTITLLIIAIIITVINPMLFPSIFISIAYPFCNKLIYNYMTQKAKDSEEIKNQIFKYTNMDTDINTKLMYTLEMLNQKVYAYIERENIKTENKNITFDYLCSKSETAIKDYLKSNVKSDELNDDLFKEVTKSILQEKLNSGIEDIDKLLQNYEYFSKSRKRIRK